MRAEALPLMKRRSSLHRSRVVAGLIRAAALAALALIPLESASAQVRLAPAAAPASQCSGAPPVVSKAPALSGTAAIGGELKTSTGSWNNCGSRITGYSFAWYHLGFAIAFPIADANDFVYTVSSDDAGLEVYAQVVAYNAYGASGCHVARDKPNMPVGFSVVRFRRWEPSALTT